MTCLILKMVILPWLLIQAKGNIGLIDSNSGYRRERINQGGLPGYIIILIGLFRFSHVALEK